MSSIFGNIRPTGGTMTYMCVHTNNYRWCPSWDHVVGWTGIKWSLGRTCTGDKGCDHVGLMRGQLDPSKEGSNPVLLTLKTFGQSPTAGGEIQHHCRNGENSFYFILAVDQTGKDTMGLVKINLLEPPPTNRTKRDTGSQSD